LWCAVVDYGLSFQLACHSSLSKSTATQQHEELMFDLVALFVDSDSRREKLVDPIQCFLAFSTAAPLVVDFRLAIELAPPWSHL
jgi:hypothetical protein